MANNNSSGFPVHLSVPACWFTVPLLLKTSRTLGNPGNLASGVQLLSVQVPFNRRLLKAYKSVYDAAVFCLEHGGRLAGKVEEPLEATRHCATIEGRLLVSKVPQPIPIPISVREPVYFGFSKSNIPFNALRLNIHRSSPSGSCAPSLLARDGSCYQWSPVDGSETKIPCNSSQLKTRFICEEDEYRR